VLLQTQSNLLVLAEVSSGAASYAGKARQLPTCASLALRRSEVLLQVRVLLVASLCWLVWLQDRVFDRCKRCLQSRCSSTTAAPS
jgi:hypothetical protein